MAWFWLNCNHTLDVIQTNWFINHFLPTEIIPKIAGFIDASELQHVMSNLGERLDEAEIDEMLREADVDVNHGGRINYKGM